MGQRSSRKRAIRTKGVNRAGEPRVFRPPGISMVSGRKHRTSVGENMQRAINGISRQVLANPMHKIRPGPGISELDTFRFFRHSPETQKASRSPLITEMGLIKSSGYDPTPK